MRRRVRVLVVDDSVVVRRAVSEMLSSDPLIEVVGTASNGRLALERVVQQVPDLVVLDVEMPEMDGLEALRQLRRTHPLLPVLMFSALTEKGASLTLDALAAGASDYVTKPASVGRHQVSLEQVRTELLAKTKALGAAVLAASEPPQALPASGLSAAPAPASRIEVVVIGASTGGPNAVSDVLASVSPRFRVPILIVQHMPPVFTRIFADRLSAQHGLEVREARDGESVSAGQVWIAPGDYHMALRRDGQGVRIATHQGPPENSCRPAVDVLFRSAAACHRNAVLGIVLTGMGQDGLRGCEDIRRAGGQVVVQDEPTSVVWSMPGSVAKAGLAHEILPLDQIGPEILRRVGADATKPVQASAFRGSGA